MALTRNDYIRFLSNEAIRKGAHKNPNFYPELIKFIQTPQGLDGFSMFKKLNPSRIGVAECAPKTFKKAF